MAARQAFHAGSWYSDDERQLDSELSRWLEAVDLQEGDNFSPPISGCKAIIAPHAGYSYSGPAAAWAYRSIDTRGIKRVFILGPSHHVYLDGCALSKCWHYETPVGDLPLNRKTIDKLFQTGKFTEMTIEQDQEEHSIEMHLPYVRKIFKGSEISVVPILVGAITKRQEEEYGALLAAELASEDTIFVISSDFCHWGVRFRYTFYYPESPPTNTLTHLSTNGPSPLADRPIHQSIHDLDHEAMQILTLPRNSGASEVHRQFTSYLKRTKNTICGRHPIGVLLGALTSLESQDMHPTIQWVRYEQSSKCFTLRDSSVSYASAFITL